MGLQGQIKIWWDRGMLQSGLVAKGFTQVKDLDFHETFALFAKLVLVWVFLTVTVMLRWDLYQMDVNNVFLHIDLDEEVYMKLPPGFLVGHKGKVCRLRKSLYGLRQASRNWFAKLRTVLQQYGFYSIICRLFIIHFSPRFYFLGITCVCWWHHFDRQWSLSLFCF